jgi:hypothetical protein
LICAICVERILAPPPHKDTAKKNINLAKLGDSRGLNPTVMVGDKKEEEEKTR